MKTFGCLAIAYNHNKTTKKFYPSTIVLVLGIPSNPKGFKLLNLLTKCAFA